MGPWIVTDIDPGSLDIETYVNGDRKQCSNTRQILFDPLHLVHFVSWVMTLYPGDVIASGTPAGIGPLEAGDQVEIRVQVRRKGTKSLTYDFVFVRDGEELAKGSMTSVCCEVGDHELRAIPIPDEIAGQIEEDGTSCSA